MRTLLLLFALSIILFPCVLAATSCQDLSCGSDQMCRVNSSGDAACIGFRSIRFGGVLQAYPYGSCLAQQPFYLDYNGEIIANYCWGEDKIIGTRDDCGCSQGSRCLESGACGVACYDGTPAGECVADKKPLYCTPAGVLMSYGRECGCPQGSILLSNGRCSQLTEFVARGNNEFADGIERGVTQNPATFSNLARYKQVNAGGCTQTEYLTDGIVSLARHSSALWSDQFCKIGSGGETFIIDFGRQERLDSILLTFGYPFIVDYQIDYYDGTNWRFLLSGHNEFEFERTDYYIQEFTLPSPEYQQPDAGHLELLYEYPSLGRAARLAATRADYNGVHYMAMGVVKTFEPIIATKLRVRPVHWQEGATLYEIEAYSTDSALELTSAPARGVAPLTFNTSGSYESEVYFADANSENIRFSTLTWDVASRRAPSTLIRETNVVANASAVNFFDGLGGESYFGLDYFGFNGSAAGSPTPYRNILWQPYPGAYTPIYYSKHCLHDGTWEGVRTTFADWGSGSRYCVMHPAVMNFSNVINASSGEIISYRTPVRFDFRSFSPLVDRVVLSELISRVERVTIYRYEGTTYQLIGTYALGADGSSNVRTTLFFPPTPADLIEVQFLTKATSDIHTQSAVLWELGVYSTLYEAPSGVRNPGDYTIGLQFRSGKTREDVLRSEWLGPGGVAGTYFISSGQDLGSIHNNNQYFQYRVIMQTPDTRDTPVVDNITISYSGGASKPPVARITMPHQASVGEEITLSGSESFNADGTIVTYLWSFDDGYNASGSTIRRTFTTSGARRVFLTVIDSEGQRARAEDAVFVEVFDCLTPEETGSQDSVLFPMNDPMVRQVANDALREYANARGISVSAIDSAEERMDAALAYINNHMSYRSDDENRRAVPSSYQPPAGEFGDFAMSLPIMVQYSGSSGCTSDADFCGDCEDYSILFTTLARAMGVNSKCVYSASSSLNAAHVFNVINYHGKWRVLEPQQGSLTRDFSAVSLSWNSSGTPFYFVASVFNDHRNSYRDIYTKNLASNGALTNLYITNNVSSNGLPSAVTRCDGTPWPLYRTLRSEFGGWDPATLFKEVCP